MKAGSVTVVAGYVSRIVYVTGLDACLEAYYEYALRINIHYGAPQDASGPPQLIPESRAIKITIQPLSLTVTIPVEG